MENQKVKKIMIDKTFLGKSDHDSLVSSIALKFLGKFRLIRLDGKLQPDLILVDFKRKQIYAVECQVSVTDSKKIKQYEKSNFGGTSLTYGYDKLLIVRFKNYREKQRLKGKENYKKYREYHLKYSCDYYHKNKRKCLLRQQKSRAKKLLKR